VDVSRGDVWWAELPDPSGAAPGFRRPVLVIQADPFNRSRIGTVVVIALTTSMRLLDAPGNVLLSAKMGGLSKDSVVNVSQVVTIDRSVLVERAGKASRSVMQRVGDGLRLVLGF
jgi:mRNA interferase MazF